MFSNIAFLSKKLTFEHLTLLEKNIIKKLSIDMQDKQPSVN